jgi:hypothetical protein
MRRRPWVAGVALVTALLACSDDGAGVRDEHPAPAMTTAPAARAY